MYNGSEFPDQYIKRKELVDAIYNRGYNFSIYGPSFLEELYPKSYKGFAQYNETNKVFNRSKINICTHVLCNKNKYLNERSILISGSGGLLFIDPIKGLKDIFLPGRDCVTIDKDNYLKQIDSILSNYNEYKEMKENLFQRSKNYTWDRWAEQIKKEL